MWSLPDGGEHNASSTRRRRFFGRNLSEERGRQVVLEPVQHPAARRVEQVRLTFHQLHQANFTYLVPGKP